MAKISDVLDRDTNLINLKCAGMSDGKLCFTNVGALFFRTNDEDVEFRHAGIVCGLFKGTNKAYVLDAKELNGDIVNNVNDAIIFLKKHLRISFKIEGLRRENILELPEDALREAIVNAVCHRNYFEHGSRIMVEIFDDRVDIVSPGGVCKGITPENFGTISITRNPLVQSMFYRMDYIEQMGTSIMRMREATKEADVAEPKFELENFFRVTFKRTPLDTSSGRQAVASDCQTTFSISGNEGVNGGIGGVNGGDGGLSGGVSGGQTRQEQILQVIKDIPNSTVEQITERTGISKRTVERELKSMRDIRIKREGSDKIGCWRIIES
jgi:ATP-dependent DNA helicase RecG